MCLHSHVWREVTSVLLRSIESNHVRVYPQLSDPIRQHCSSQRQHISSKVVSWCVFVRYWRHSIWSLNGAYVRFGLVLSEPTQCYLLDCLGSAIRFGTVCTHHSQLIIRRIDYKHQSYEQIAEPPTCTYPPTFITFISKRLQRSINSPNKYLLEMKCGRPDLLWIHLSTSIHSRRSIKTSIVIACLATTVEATGDTETMLAVRRRKGQAFGEKIIALIESYFIFTALFMSLHWIITRYTAKRGRR